MWEEYSTLYMILQILLDYPQIVLQNGILLENTGQPLALIIIMGHYLIYIL